MHVFSRVPKGLLLLLLSGTSLAHKRQSDPVDPGTASDCTYFLKARDASFTCTRFENEGGISHADFVSWNPSVKDDCSGIKVGNDYCLEVNFGLPRSTTVMQTTTTTTTTTTSSVQPPATTTTPSLPSPTQDGLTKDCLRFYMAKSGDTCDTIVASYGTFTLNDFINWNPAVGTSCKFLLSQTYYCVGVAGTPTTRPPTVSTSSPSPVQPDNGIQTPQPTQPNMVKNCVKFHFVSKGNTCDQITSYNGISQSDFTSWNPQIGEKCTGMWADAYACVGVAAFSLKSRYHVDCTGDIHNNVTIGMDQGYCMNTGCQVGSLEIAADGLCPNGQVQLSYWEKSDCSGKWYGYGYAAKATCRKLWTDGWKFKGIHLRCARMQDDCSSKRTCTMDPEPQQNAC